MKTSKRIVATALTATTVITLICGCARTAKYTYYTLQPISTPGNAITDTERVILVRIESIPEYLRRPQIISLKDNGEIKMQEFQRWGEDIEDGISRVLIHELRTASPSSVLYTSGITGISPDSKVSINIEELIASGDKAVASVSWSTSEKEDPTIIKNQRFSTKLKSNSPEDIIQAYNRLLQSIAMAITKESTP